MISMPGFGKPTQLALPRLSVLASRIATLCFILFSSAALAHVKWFAPYDLLCPPRPLFSVVYGTFFLTFCGVMVLVMFATAYIDVLLVQRAHALNEMVRKVSDFFEPNAFLLLRTGVFLFLLAVSYMGNVLLTPELQTEWPWVRWLQLLMAVLVVMPKTAYLTAIGIGILYFSAVYQYGWFHLLDYPIFLGVAAYLFIMSRYGEEKSELALTVLRVLTGITLLWAGMEKFAYPEWSFPLLKARPSVSLGFDPEFYMVAAGFVEFTAAFLLITVSIAARVASALLLVIFSAAVPEFGIVDLVGHFVIIIVLIVLIFTHNPIADKFKGLKNTASAATLFVVLYFAALAAEGSLFYAAHWLAYGV